MGDMAAINGIPRATLSGWAKRLASNSRAMFGKQAAANDLIIEYWSDGQIYYQASRGTWAEGHYSGPGSNDTSWHHSTLVFYGTLSGNSNRLKGYLDGQVASLAYSGTVDSVTTTNTAPFNIGLDGYGTPSQAQFDEVRLSDVARSAALALTSSTVAAIA